MDFLHNFFEVFAQCKWKTTTLKQFQIYYKYQMSLLNCFFAGKHFHEILLISIDAEQWRSTAAPITMWLQSQVGLKKSFGPPVFKFHPWQLKTRDRNAENDHCLSHLTECIIQLQPPTSLEKPPSLTEKDEFSNLVCVRAENQRCGVRSPNELSPWEAG